MGSVPSIWEVFEVLRVFGRLSTSEIVDSLGAKSATDISKLMRHLEVQNKIRRVGVKLGKRKTKTIVWEITESPLRTLKKYGYKSFYDLPAAKESEMKRFEKWGKGFKRFF